MVVTVSVLAWAGPPPLLGAEQAPEARRVEIFVEGKKYDSLEEYREEEKNKILEAVAATQKEDSPVDHKKEDLDELQDMFGQAVRRAQRPLDLKFDPRKVKTLYLKNLSSRQQPKKVGQDPVSLKGQGSAVADPFAPSYAVFHQAGFNTGINRVVKDFTVGNEAPGDPRRVNAQDLERVLQKSLGMYDGPLLLMSDQKRIRVMVLEPPEDGALGNAKMRTQ